MSDERKKPPRRATMAIVAHKVGGQGKTLFSTTVVDLHSLHNKQTIVVQIDDQQRLAKTIGQEVVGVDAQTLRASRSNPSAGVHAFRPLTSALERASAALTNLVLDLGGMQVKPLTDFASLAELDDDLVELGFEGYAFIPTVAAAEAIAQAAPTIEMLAQSLPSLRPVLVENRRDGGFDTLAPGSEAHRALHRLRETYPGLPEIVMPAIEAGSWRHFEPHYCRPIDVAAMDIGTVMQLTGLPKSEAKIVKGDVAAWVVAMERVLAPFFGLPEVLS